MEKITVAVVGLGYWGPNLIRNFLKIDGVIVKIGCDLLPENIKKISTIYPAVITTASYNTLLSDREIDLIAIATPLETHFRLAKLALAHNKHVLIEKPMTQTSREAKILIDLAKKKKKHIFVGHTFVYSSAVQKIKELLDKKELGKLYYYDSTRINLGLIQQRTNVIWDLATHDLAILQYLIKEKPVSIQAFGSSFLNMRNEEFAHIFIRYKNNISAHIQVSWLSPVKIRNILLGGSKKMIVYNDIEPSEKIRIYDRSVRILPKYITPFTPAYRSGNVIIPHLEQKESLEKELGHCIDVLNGRAQPLTDGTAGLHVIQMLEAIDKAIKTKSEIKIHE